MSLMLIWQLWQEKIYQISLYYSNIQKILNMLFAYAKIFNHKKSHFVFGKPLQRMILLEVAWLKG